MFEGILGILGGDAGRVKDYIKYTSNFDWSIYEKQFVAVLGEQQLLVKDLLVYSRPRVVREPVEAVVVAEQQGLEYKKVLQRNHDERR